jgi:multiple sugar transport system substrate-binding protein
MIELTGITWQHTRGYLPMVATAQRFAELNPSVAIRWDVRSLQAFADHPIEELAKRFDLLMIDHPFCGRAARGDVLLPLDEVMEPSFLEEQKRNAVGLSYESYVYGGHLWALPTDTAAPVSGARMDLMGSRGMRPPKRWSELLELARLRVVVVPGLAIDSLMSFYMLCIALGEMPFQRDSEVVSIDTGIRAAEMLRELLSHCDRKCLERNPIATWELMSSTDEAVYCPFAYGYSNYSRPRYARKQITFGGLVQVDGHGVCRSTLGGAGLSISKHVRARDVAADYVAFVASRETQTGIYFDAGGQPGHGAAWLDAEVNRRSCGFFENTLGALDTAYLRPRFDGYLWFQESAGTAVHNYLSDGGAVRGVIDKLNGLLQEARRMGTRH